MKKTSKEFMEWLGLKVGDKVRTKDNFTFEVCKDNLYFLKGINIPENKGLEFLIDLEVDVLPAPKRVGDLKCKDLECENCPLRALISCNSHDNNNQRLFDNLAEWTNEYISFDQEIYDLLKARLDKEVKDND